MTYISIGYLNVEESGKEYFMELCNSEYISHYSTL